MAEKIFLLNFNQLDADHAVPEIEATITISGITILDRAYCRNTGNARRNFNVVQKQSVSYSITEIYVCFLVDRTNGRAYATVLRLSVCPSVTLCIVAKRCVLEQKLLLRAYRKSYMRNRLVPKSMTLTFVQRSYQGHVNHCVTLDVEYLGNRQRQRLGSKGPPIGNGMRDIEWSRDR